MALARMRTIIQVVEYLKEEDPKSCISEHYLRQLVKQNKVPVFYAGRKALINLDKLLEYLAGDLPEADLEPAQRIGVIRKVQSR